MPVCLRHLAANEKQNRSTSFACWTQKFKHDGNYSTWICAKHKIAPERQKRHSTTAAAWKPYITGSTGCHNNKHVCSASTKTSKCTDKHYGTKSISLVARLRNAFHSIGSVRGSNSFGLTSNQYFNHFPRLHSEHWWTIFRRYVPYFYSSLRLILRPEP